MRFNEEKWISVKNHQLFSIASEKNKNNLVINVLSASQEKGMIPRNEIGIDISFDKNSISNYKIVNIGDYVVHLRSFQGGFAFSKQEGICSPAYTILRPNLKDLSNSFFESYFTSQKFINSLKLVTYGIRDGRSISVDEWLNMSTYIPSREIQDKIINFIENLNLRINTQNKIIEDLETQMKAIRCCLLSNINTFSMLSDLCSISTGKLDANCMNENGKYPFFTCGKETLKIDDYAFDCEAILISGNGDIGHTKYYVGKFNAYQRTYILHSFKGNAKYIKSAIDYVLPRKVLEETQSSAMPYIKMGTLSDLKIPFPSLTLQDRIVDVLEVFQHKLNIEAQILEKLKEQKKYLLSNMFI